MMTTRTMTTGTMTTGTTTKGTTTRSTRTKDAFTLLLILCVGTVVGCSISNSSGSISDSVSSPFEWSSDSSDSSSADDDAGDDGAEAARKPGSGEYGEDLRQLASTYALAGGDIGAFRSAVSQLARTRGLTNWEADPLTCSSIGLGLRDGGMTGAAFASFSAELFGEDPTKLSALRKGYATSTP